MKCTGASYIPSTHNGFLEQRVRSGSKIDDTPGLIALLQEILVFDPLRRPGVSDLLNHPWLVGSSDPVALSVLESESDSSGED